MRIGYAMTGLALMAALAGCERTSYSYQPAPVAPAPLAAQPVGNVQSSDLSAPGQGQDLAPNQFPPAPAAADGQQQMASANLTPPPANSLDVTKDQMVGGWKVTTGGSTCNMFLTLTKFGNASRGGTSRCVGPLTAMRAWNVSGKQVVLMDATGNTIGRLYKTADNQFDGSVNGGGALTMTR